MSNRRERFREAMARLDAAADPAHAIERGFYVERPDRSVASELAARLEIRPASSHLIIGRVGSGKTTQLLVARDKLNQLTDTHAIYIDVSQKYDISRMVPGALIDVAGIPISKLLGEQDGAKNPIGLLEAIENLIRLHSALREKVPNVILIVDSLDRITDPIAFAEVVEQDVAAIRWAGIGVVLAGPLRSMYGTDRPITDRFDYFYYQPAIDVPQDAAGRDFLVRVLRAREPADFLPDPICQRLADLSGGVLRDLISLAQLAVEEAYLDGVDAVEEHHVEAAADAFGRKHMLGLGSDELEVLQRVHVHGSFVQTSDKDLALLVTRRVLEYQNGRTRYAVHPTIAPLLEQLAVKP